MVGLNAGIPTTSWSGRLENSLLEEDDIGAARPKRLLLRSDVVKTRLDN